MNFKQYLTEDNKHALVDGGNRIAHKNKKEKINYGGKQARKGLKQLRKGTPLTARQRKALRAHFKDDNHLNQIAGELGTEFVGNKVYDNQEPEPMTPAERKQEERAAREAELERRAKIEGNKKARKANITINSKQRKLLATKITQTRSAQLDKNNTIEKKESLSNLKVRLKRIERETKKRSRDAEEEQ